jgi:hypothetical protein
VVITPEGKELHLLTCAACNVQFYGKPKQQRCDACRPKMQTQKPGRSRSKRLRRRNLEVKSLQLGVFDFGLFEDGNVGIGVFPEGEEILIRGAGFGGVALQHIGASELNMNERT